MSAEPYRTLLSHVPAKGLTLDAGCGHFGYTDFLKNSGLGSEIVCTDIFNKNADERQNNTFLLSSVESLPFKDESFDFIFCMSVIELIENDVSVINELHRILRGDGKLLITLPTKFSAFRILRTLEIASGTYQFPEFNVKRYHYYSRGDLKKLVGKKFRILSLKGYEYNFLPRMTNFLKAILKTDKPLNDGKAKKIETLNPLRNSSAQPNRLSKVSKSKINFASDFSYHHIAVLEKQATS